MKDLKQFIKTTIREFLNENSSNYDYNISYEEFDGIDNSVWRKLAHSGQEKKAIEYMINYLNVNKSNLEKYQIGGILWHIGQLYAFINDYDNAIKYMSNNSVRDSIETNYQMGTIAFLKNDYNELKKYYNVLLKSDPTGGSGRDILKRFIDGFNKTYNQVY
jgi:tetratricopeptide (TPR) repeat protein